MSVSRTFHFQSLSQAHETAELVRNSDVQYVKCVDPPGDNPFPGKRVLVRMIHPNEANMIKSGASGARVWWDQMEPQMRERSWAWGFETGCNEPICTTNVDCQKAAMYEVEWIKRCRELGFVQKSVVLNFSMGVPEPEYAPIFAEAIRRADFLGVHEYWKKKGPHDPAWYGWLTQRYRRFYAALGFTKPTLITESGIALGDPLGWRDAGISGGKYAQECVEYADECELDKYVEAVFFFTCGGGDKWKRFEFTTDQVRMILAGNKPKQTIPIQPPAGSMADPYGIPPLHHPCPGAVVSQRFGENPSWYAPMKGHNGVDLVKPEGTPILAMHGGEVLNCWDETGYGKYIYLRAQGYTKHFNTLYGHLQMFAKRSYQIVKPGDVIGYLGHTGRCISSIGGTGAHLHVGLRSEGALYNGYRGYIDPVPYWRYG